MGNMILVVICVSDYIKMTEEGMVRNCLRGDTDSMLENSVFRVVDNWNSLSACCVNSSSINCFKKYVSTELESGAV